MTYDWWFILNICFNSVISRPRSSEKSHLRWSRHRLETDVCVAGHQVADPEVIQSYVKRVSTCQNKLFWSHIIHLNIVMSEACDESNVLCSFLFLLSMWSVLEGFLESNSMPGWKKRFCCALWLKGPNLFTSLWSDVQTLICTCNHIQEWCHSVLQTLEYTPTSMQQC